MNQLKRMKHNLFKEKLRKVWLCGVFLHFCREIARLFIKKVAFYSIKAADLSKNREKENKILNNSLEKALVYFQITGRNSSSFVV